LTKADGGCGFAILYNTYPRTVLALRLLALVDNELSLVLNDPKTKVLGL